MKSILYTSLILLWFSATNVVLSQSSKHVEYRPNLTNSDVNYIYNRALDLAIRDKRSSWSLSTVYGNEDYIKYDTILVTVDPYLSYEAFRVKYIKAIDTIKFEHTLNVQSKFDSIFLYYPDNIKYVHYDSIPPLTGHHMMHIKFSDIYVENGFMYVGVMVTHQLFNSAPYFNDTFYSIFKFQFCNNKFILFRNIYFGLGVIDGKAIYNVANIEDRDCY